MWINDADALKSHAIFFFSKIYTLDDTTFTPYGLSGLFPSLNPNEISEFAKPVSNMEIFKAISDMNLLKAPGIDGLNAGFYCNHWKTVGHFVCALVKDVFEGKGVPHEINRTLLVLILKKENPDSLKLHRPISLCTVMYKTVTKLIANWLKGLLPNLIGPTQTSFIPRRNIMDNVVIVQEVIQSIKRKSERVRFMIVKVDLKKEYDMLCWDFINDTLLDAGLPATMVKIIMDCIISPFMQILWNGETTSEFYPSRGIQQGDPISPYIFVLCIERLAQGINAKVNSGNWKTIARQIRNPSLAFVFCR